MHNVITRGGQTVLAEAAIAVGHPLGSLQLDRAFLEYFRVEVGEEVRGWIETGRRGSGGFDIGGEGGVRKGSVQR